MTDFPVAHHVPSQSHTLNFVYGHMNPAQVHAVGRGKVKIIHSHRPVLGCGLYVYADLYSFPGRQEGLNALVLCEPTSVLPGQYDERKWGQFDHVFTYYRFVAEKYGFTRITMQRHGYLFEKEGAVDTAITEDRDERERKYPVSGRRPAMCMINGNKRSVTPGELYSKRVEAAQWFHYNSPLPFDVFGNPPFILPNYRGSVEKNRRLYLLSRYKYYLCFENTNHPEMALGYVDKILDCLETRTLPVYLGCPDIDEYIPRGCFIDFRDFDGYGDLDRYLRSMDEGEYMQYIGNIDDFVASGGLRRYSWQTFYDALVDYYAKSTGLHSADILEGDGEWALLGPEGNLTYDESPFYWSFQDLASAHSPLVDYENGGYTPHDPAAHMQRATEFSGQGKYGDALREMAWLGFTGDGNLHFFAAQLMHVEDLREAELVQLKVALQLNPGHSHAHNQMGVLLLSQNQVDEAEKEFRKSMELDQGNLTAMKNLAFLMVRTGRVNEAVPLIRHLEPHFPEVKDWLPKEEPRPEEDPIQAGIRLQMNGRLDEAERIYRGILDKDPKNPDPHHLLGIIAYQTGRYNEAVSLINKAVSLNKSNPAFFCNLGLAHAGLREFDQAVTAYHRALKLHPRYPEALNNLGNTYRELDKVEETVECYRKALALVPGSAEVLYNLGSACHEAGKMEEAFDCYHRALAIVPDSPDIYNNLAVIYKDRKEYDKAVECAHRALKLRPVFPDVHLNLGLICKDTGLTDEAIAHYDRALSLSPGSMEAMWGRAFAQIPIFYESEEEIMERRNRYRDSLEALDRLVTLSTAPDIRTAARLIGTTRPDYLPYQGLNDRVLQSLYGDLVCRIQRARYPEFAGPLPGKGRKAGKKIRVGIVSDCFCDHPSWDIMIKGWVENLDRERFALYGYYTGTTEDYETAAARKAFSRFVEGARSHEALRDTIRGDRLDVLIYPEIGMNPAFTRLASLRLAPVQCASWAYPETTGLPTIDYYLSGDLMEPEDGDSHYSEKLVRLPNLSIHCAPVHGDTSSFCRADFGLPPDSVIYFCAGSLFRYLPQYDDLFPRIAREVENSKFVFIGNTRSTALTDRFRERLERAFGRYALKSSSHMIMLPRLDRLRYHAMNVLSDAFLDGIGWSGWDATLTAIACGLPVVTLPGSLMRGRRSFAVLTMMGVTETIAENFDDYVARAVRLGTDRAWRNGVREHISAARERLYNDRESIRGLESFLEEAVRASLL